MIDLTLLPAPNVVEPLDFETVFADLKAMAIAQDSTLASALQYESEPLSKLLQVYAYREIVLRQRINDAARSVMLAYAAGSDLGQIGARYGVARLLIQEADINAVPPVEVLYESDAAFRRRILLSLDAYTTAGSQGSYIFHALSASGDVLDAAATSPAPGQVTMYVLSRLDDGTASAELLAAVTAAVNAEFTRPMTDQVTVLSASIINYAITGTLIVSHGPDSETVRQTALAAAAQYAADMHRMGIDISLSGVYRALHQPGVLQVDLAMPTANIVVSVGQAGHCTGITLDVEVANG